MTLSSEEIGQVIGLASRLDREFLKRGIEGTFPVPVFRPATVALLTNPGAVAQAKVDGDLSNIDVINATGNVVPGGARVLVAFLPPHGVFATSLLTRLTLAGHAYRAAALNIAGAASTTLLTVDTAAAGDNPMGIINLSTGRATIPLAGWWDICGHASASLNNNPEQFELNLYKNAVLHKSGGRVMVRGGVGADVHSATLATCVRLVSGDVVDLRVDHITGGNAIALSTGVQHNWLSVSLKEAI